MSTFETASEKAEAAVMTVKETISAAEEKISKAKREVCVAEEKVSKAEEKVSKAEEKVNKAEEKVREAREEVSKAEKKVNEAEEKVSEAEEKGRRPLERAEKALERAERALERAEMDLGDTRKSLELARYGVEDTRKGLELAQKGLMLALTQLQDAIDNLRTVNSDLATEVDQGRINVLMAASPLSKFLLQSVASANSSSVFVWDFEGLRETKQKDRKKGFREQLAKHYGVWRDDKNRHCQCQISGVVGDGNVVTAAHLLPHSTKNHLKQAYGKRDINDPRNALILAKNIEKALERGRIYFVQEQNDRTYLLKYWDVSVLKEPVHKGAKMTIGDCVDKHLFIPEKVDPPFKRILSDHAQRSYLYALGKCWIKKSVPEPEEYGSPLKDNVLSITKMSTTSEKSEWGGSRTVASINSWHENRGDEKGTCATL